jgi:hypothetical protein
MYTVSFALSITVTAWARPSLTGVSVLHVGEYDAAEAVGAIPRIVDVKTSMDSITAQILALLFFSLI